MSGAVTAGGENSITRVEHEGRVYRWERQGSWPGHTSFVALRGAEVVIGDRYAKDGIERSYTCHPQDLLDGLFDEAIDLQFGEAVRQEVLTAVRAQLGPAAAPKIVEPQDTAEAEAVPAPEPEAAPEPAATPEAAAESSARVSVTLTACPSLDLPLVVALRRITRAPVAERLSALQAPPCVLVPDVPRAEGESIAQRLRALGATIELTAAAS